MTFPAVRLKRARRALASLCSVCLFFVPLQGHSQGRTDSDLAPTVVTATRSEQPLGDLVADVTVLDRTEIERSGATALPDLLARLPGIEMVRNGGPGTTSTLYLRGAESRFTAVYVDGVRVDSQSTGGAPWEALTLAQIDRVEILRGPAGAVYGSDALGGVIQIFTRKGQGPWRPYAAVGLGSYGKRTWEAGFSGAQGRLDYALGLAREASSGFNARTTAGYNGDDDGYANESLSGRLGWQLDPRHRLELTALSSAMDAQYDASNTRPAVNNDDHALNLMQTRGLNWRAQWSERYSTQLSLTESRAQYETKPSTYLTMTRLNGYLLHNEYRVGPHQLSAALERKVDYLENGLTGAAASAIVRDRSQDGLALGYGWRSPRHTLQLNVRQDQDSEFGGQGTGSLAYGYALSAHWRATASVGTGYRVPTLFQRFGTSGLASLQSETSRNSELGLRYSQGSTAWGVVFYQNQVSNLITFVRNQGSCPNNTPPTKGSTPGCYFNTAQAEYTGATLSGQQRLAAVNLRASLDIQSVRDVGNGNFLPRRANHHASLSADTLMAGWLVGAGVQLSGARYDDTANTIVLPGYSLWSVHASRRLQRDWSVLLRVDNLGDAPYVLASGYATPGRSLYAALRWSPQP